MDISVKERSERAMAYFREGYNCNQSVALAFSDIIGIDEEPLARLCCGLGGGVGRMREVCGTVTGMAMVAGSLVPQEQFQPAEEAVGHHTEKLKCYSIVQDLCEKFKADNGSIVCRDLLGLRTAQKPSPEPEKRDGHYYRTRPCEQLVGYAAALLAEKILETA